MNRTVKAGVKSGSVRIPASKSWAHRLLITAAFNNKPTELICDGISDDIEATINCLSALGARIILKDHRICVTPIDRDIDLSKETAHLYCKESGSTLRFLLPVVGAVGAKTVFHMEGRLKDRPLDDLINELGRKGMSVRKEGNLLYTEGRILPGEYSISGNISSQFISGFLMALPLLNEESHLTVTGQIQSARYIDITLNALCEGNADIRRDGNSFLIKGIENFDLKSEVTVESDWSSAAFFLSMGALSNKGICVKGMNIASIQGDKAILDVLKQFGADISITEDEIYVKKGSLSGIETDASEIPDLVPVISAVAALAEGRTRIYNAGRLRFKESDRLASVAAMIKAAGGEVTETEDGLIIEGKDRIKGGIVDSCKDHRIAMSGAVLAFGCREDVVILDSECTDKSFVNFWELLDSLELQEISE